MTENEVAKQIVDAAYRMHTSLGPGLLESVYEVVLAYELENRGLRVVRQQADYRLFRRMPERWLCPALSSACTRASPKGNAEARCPSTWIGRTTLIKRVLANRAIVRYGLDVQKASVGLKADLP